jgi:putative oxidoreductase
MRNFLDRMIDVGSNKLGTDIGLLIMRLAFGLMMLYGHGLGKLLNYSQRASHFGDPIGLGSATSLALAIFAEFFCSIGITFGFLTRFAAIALLINMSVAAFIAHAGDPFARRETALLYAVAYVTLLLLGAGKFSIDGLLSKGWSGKRLQSSPE